MRCTQELGIMHWWAVDGISVWKTMYEGIGICFRMPKSLDWHMFCFILHNVHMLEQKDKRNGRVCPFLLSGQSTRKVKIPKKHVSLPLPLSYLGTYDETNQADMDKIAPLYPETWTEPSLTRAESTEGMDSPVQLLWITRRLWRAFVAPKERSGHTWIGTEWLLKAA